MRSFRRGGGAAVGETQKSPFQLSFNRSVRVEFQGSPVTSDGSLLLVRELDERLGFGELIERHLVDGRGKNSQLPLAELVRQSVYSRLAGYEHVNDAERLAKDPAFRLIGCEKVVERGGALTSRLQSFEAELLTRPENLAGLATVNRELLAKARALAPRRRVVLDIDSTEVAVYGAQEQSAYNGHFESVCYHPLLLLLFTDQGDCLEVKLRPGKVSSAEGWEEMLPTTIDRFRAQGLEAAVRGDAAFARPEVYESVEARGAGYAIRLPANPKLEREITELRKRPVGRPSHRPVVRYKSFFHRAASWKRAWRVVAKSLP